MNTQSTTRELTAPEVLPATPESFSFVRGRADREVLDTIPLPERTATYEPVPYRRLVEIAEIALANHNLELVAERHELTSKGNKYFGILIARADGDGDDIRRAIGLRSSYDKSLPNGLAIGERVTVCSNLCFGGDITVFRKHTQRVFEDLPREIDAAISNSVDFHRLNLRYLEGLKEVAPTNSEVHDVLCKALIAGVLTSSKLRAVYSEFLHPEFDDFAYRRGYDLRQAFTHVWKDANQVVGVAERGRILDRLLKVQFRDRLIEQGAIPETTPTFAGDFDPLTSKHLLN